MEKDQVTIKARLYNEIWQASSITKFAERANSVKNRPILLFKDIDDNIYYPITYESLRKYSMGYVKHLINSGVIYYMMEPSVNNVSEILEDYNEADFITDELRAELIDQLKNDW